MCVLLFRRCLFWMKYSLGRDSSDACRLERGLGRDSSDACRLECSLRRDSSDPLFSAAHVIQLVRREFPAISGAGLIGFYVLHICSLVDSSCCNRAGSWLSPQRIIGDDLSLAVT